jgi:hypothetical protein
MPLAFVVQRGLAEEFDNFMTRILTGATTDTVPIGSVGMEDVELALQNIRTRFRFVGLVECLQAHYSALCDILDIPERALGTENVRRIDPSDKSRAQVDWTEVMHRNRFDAMLYQRVRSEGLCGVDLAALRMVASAAQAPWK